MPEKIVREYVVYQYDELSDEAKEKVLERLCEINTWHDWWDCLYMDFFEELKAIGVICDTFYWDIDRDNYIFMEKPSIEDTEAFVGAIDVEMSGREREYLLEYGLVIETVHQGYGVSHNRVNKNGSLTPDRIVLEYHSFLHSKLEDFLNRLREEYYWLMEREQIEDTIRANGYQFLEDGSSFR